MNTCPERTAPPPLEFTIQNFHEGRPITYRCADGRWFHRLGTARSFVATQATSYPGAAAHARHYHGILDPFGRAAA